MPRPAISQNPVRSCNIKQTIIASSRKFQYFRGDDKNKGKGFGVAGIISGGFCLGILGFFEKKEELTPEDELLIKIKRSILAIQVILR